MVRKLLAVTALSTLPMGLFVALGAGSAQAAAPVTFKGSISCSLMGGITFKPPLANSNTTKSTTAVFQGLNSQCKGVQGTKLTQGGAILQASIDKFSFKLPANANGSCGALASGALPAISMAVSWLGTGTAPITASKLAFPAGSLSASNGLLEYLKGKSTGSFAGAAQTAMQATKISLGNGKVVKFTIANAGAACAASGIKDLTLSQPNPEPKPFSKNDNLEVGKAF